MTPLGALAEILGALASASHAVDALVQLSARVTARDARTVSWLTLATIGIVTGIWYAVTLLISDFVRVSHGGYAWV